MVFSDISSFFSSTVLLGVTDCLILGWAMLVGAACSAGNSFLFLSVAWSTNSDFKTSLFTSLGVAFSAMFLKEWEATTSVVFALSAFAARAIF